MDFVEWADTVLRALTDVAREVNGGLTRGVHANQLAPKLFGPDAAIDSLHGSEPWQAMADAVLSLMAVGAIEKQNSLSQLKVTREGREHARNPLPYWQTTCAETVDPDEEQLLRLVNCLSPKPGASYVRLRAVAEEEAAHELSWPNARSRVHGWARTLVDAGYLRRLNFDLVASYKGLVWETRQAFTEKAALIDQLAADWETTSVDHKQELELGSNDQKAELVKDLIALANTLASGRRWMVIGFHDKTRAYHKPPTSSLTGDRLIDIIQQYVTPYLDVRYEVVEYRDGPVGLLEVLPERAKLPYTVSKGLKGTKRKIEPDDLWVRHGSHRAKPDQKELDALEEEATRAREARA